ncbi:SusC/RagA family TonB-linked outer membrane protein [Flavihumibacter petaseus]|uniref:Putative TonB-dependent receptor n=1 Tax=Flavihumibacter petaseus NBRC 106054 TaxID=1220578 RepID=A0A0E9N7W5_9BACT|nr:TonB-dependent receptor [Flavihumibacter petaseus]GAO45455.1 putative TonB-dependent receptor [Flavihumibacter petaseus NBRC 106054]
MLLIVLSPSLLLAQTRIISGKVVSGEDGKPMPGVTIELLPSHTSTQTGADGNFSISAGSDTAIVATSVGFARQQQRLGDGTAISFTLFHVKNLLDDVVVVGYGTQKKRDLTGSVSSISNKEIKSLPVANAGEAMQGRAAGVQVISSGAPGSNVAFRIRGIGTINNSEPLLVIDGIPSDAPLNTISPDDIASIEVLKDASAAAIYGSRGANGVVIITTKRGNSEGSHLELKAFAGVQKATSMVPLLDASQFASLHNEMMSANGQPQNPAYANPVSLGKGTDWMGALFSTAPIQNYSLSYYGGSAKSNYYVSGAMLDQKGIVLNTGYRRYTVQFNSESRVLDWLKFGNNLTLNHDQKTSGDYDIRNTMAALPVQPIYNPDGSWSGPAGQSSWYGDINNPIGKATINENSTKGYNVIGNLYAEVRLFKDLTFKTTGGVQALFWDSRSWAPKYPWVPIPNPLSSLYQQSNKSLTWLWDNYFTYNKTIGQHRLTVLAGTSAQNNRYDWLSASGKDFASDHTQQMGNSNPAYQTTNGSGSEWALMSFIGRVNYTYNDKYLLTATLRRDGSSRFGENNRWGWFPSASFAWRVSNEDFYHSDLINDFKVRIGYGVTGNQNIGNYSFASVLQTVNYNFNGQLVNAVVPQMIPNPNVKWESVEQANIGVDLSLLDSRINITADAYVKNTTDMLVPMSVPISTGYSDILVPYINAGKVQNKGIELTINTRNLRGALEWNTSFNISYNENKIVSLNDSVPMFASFGGGLNQNTTIQNAGHPINSFYGFVTNGIFQNQAEVDKYASQVPGADPYNRTSAGDIRFRDLDNNGKIDDNDRTYIGNPNPSLIFAMNNTFAWKGIDLSIFLQGVSGNKIFNANRVYQEGMAVAQNQTTKVLDRWTGEGTSNSMPRAIFNDPNKNTRISDRFVEDGSYLRIKNITLGYTLPGDISRKAKMSSARIYLSCQNLYTFTNYSGFDPEVAASGIDYNLYPVTRTISAGINLVF